MSVLAMRYLVGSSGAPALESEVSSSPSSEDLPPPSPSRSDEIEGISKHSEPVTMLQLLALIKMSLLLFAIRTTDIKPMEEGEDQQQQQKSFLPPSSLLTADPTPWFSPFDNSDTSGRGRGRGRGGRGRGRRGGFSSQNTPTTSRPEIPLLGSSLISRFGTVLEHISILYPLVGVAVQSLMPSPPRETRPPLFPCPGVASCLMDGAVFSVLLEDEEANEKKKVDAAAAASEGGSGSGSSSSFTQNKFHRNRHNKQQQQRPSDATEALFLAPSSDLDRIQRLFETGKLFLRTPSTAAHPSFTITPTSPEWNQISFHIAKIFKNLFKPLYTSVVSIFLPASLPSLLPPPLSLTLVDYSQEETPSGDPDALPPVSSLLETSPLTTEQLHPPYMPPDLPAVERAVDVYEHVRDHDVSIVCGETGCGKSSYIPTLLHRAHKIDQAIARERNPEEPQKRTRIYVTQPRRVAAVSLAKRVSELRGEEAGEGLVGYLIGQDRAICNHTEIFYVTVGWLVERVVHDPEFIRRCSHIVLDEVHERDVAADLLCLLVKRLLLQYRTDPSVNALGKPPKIVIMSATFDGELFANYFAPHDPPKPLYLGARRFPVTVFHLDELPEFPAFKENMQYQPPRMLLRRAIDTVNSKMRSFILIHCFFVSIF